MATPLPLQFSVSAFPDDARYTIQEFADALAERLSVANEDNISFFASGSTVPTTNQGPFLKGDKTWWTWDSATGQYVPQPLEPESLRFNASQSDLDATKFMLQIRLDSSGKATDLQYHSGGSWKSVFEDKFAQYSTTAQTTTAIQAGVKTYAASARPSSDQTIPVDYAFHKLKFETEIFDLDSSYDSIQSRYTAPVGGVYRVSIALQVDNDDANPASMEIGVIALVGGIFPTSVYAGLTAKNAPGDRWFPSSSGLVKLNQGDYLEIHMRATDTVGAGDIKNTVNSVVSFELVEATA